MRTAIGFAALSFFVVGCATTKSANHGPTSPCAKDLMDRGYVSGRGESAETYCTQYSPGEIAIAKDLYDKKYEPRFAQGLNTAQAHTPAQIACAKKERDTWKGNGRAPSFGVPDSCVDATFHDSGRPATITASAAGSSVATSATPPSTGAAAANAVPDPTPAAPATPSGMTGDPSGGLLSATAAADAKTHSLYDVLAADKRFSKFVMLVDFVGLSKSLKAGGGPWTVLAPTNAAINRYPGGIEALKAKPDRLKTILTMHLVDGARPRSDLKLPEKKGVTGKKWPTAQGRNLTLVDKNGHVIINDDVKITKWDIAADNGLIDVVDDLLKP